MGRAAAHPLTELYMRAYVFSYFRSYLSVSGRFDEVWRWLSVTPFILFNCISIKRSGNPNTNKKNQNEFDIMLRIIHDSSVPAKSLPFRISELSRLCNVMIITFVLGVTCSLYNSICRWRYCNPKLVWRNFALLATGPTVLVLGSDGGIVMTMLLIVSSGVY